MVTKYIRWRRQFRFHRGSLDDSMATLVTVEGLSQLADILDDHVRGFGNLSGIRIEPYGGDRSLANPGEPIPDTRIGWDDTYVVLIRGWADQPEAWTVAGFLDGPLTSWSTTP